MFYCIFRVYVQNMCMLDSMSNSLSNFLEKLSSTNLRHTVYHFNPRSTWLKKCKFWNPRDILLWSTNYHALLIQLKSGCIRPNWPFAIAGGLQEGTSKISRITFFKKCLSYVRFSLSLLFCNFCKAQPLGSLWYLEWFWYPCKLQQSRVWKKSKNEILIQERKIL